MESDQLSADELDRARAFIGICSWTYAKTVPQHPHEYCLRAWLSSDQQVEFDWFVALVAEHGYGGRFWQQTWTYLEVGAHRYWRSQTLDGSGGTIVNRAHLEPDAEPARERARLSQQDGR